MAEVRQTTDAVLDSRWLLDATELTTKKLAQDALGNGSMGVDIDEFVSKCITFMKDGGRGRSWDSVPQTQRGRRQTQQSRVDSDDEDMTEGDAMAWDILGERACFPGNRRPAAPSFLLGPLSVEKKVRNTQRTARQRKDPLQAMKKPEELREEDLERNESTNLTSLCKSIREKLNITLEEGIAATENVDEMDDDEALETFRKNHLSTNYEVPLFEFAVNPKSFGQTIENLFYISFLVKDGFVRISFDDDGLPTLRKSAYIGNFGSY